VGAVLVLTTPHTLDLAISINSFLFFFLKTLLNRKPRRR
jgi:hypothetical protein